MRKSVIILLLSIFVLSCNSNYNNSEMTNVEFSLIAKDNLYGNGAEGILKQNLIITNQTDWNNLIAQMNSVNNVSDNFTETTIDFSTFTIIAVFNEIKGNGGHGFKLNIKSNTENVIVHVVELPLEENATMVMTQPYYIVKILNSDLPIIFQ